MKSNSIIGLIPDVKGLFEKKEGEIKFSEKFLNIIEFVLEKENKVEYGERYKITIEQLESAELIKDWIPVSSKIFPKDHDEVQITYLGCNTNRPLCNAFAYRHNNDWFWSDDDRKIIVEVIAWRYNNDPYIPS